MDEIISSFDSFQKMISTEGYRDIKHINKKMKQIIYNLSNIISKYKNYDLDDIGKIINKQKELEEEIINVKEKNHQLEIQIMENKNIIDKSVKIGKDFVNKIKCILSLRKTFQELLNTPGYVGGSLIRQLFELPVALSELFDTPGYGNPIGRDIDIYLSLYEDTDLKIKFQEKIKEINNYIQFHKISPQTFPPIKFGEYELIQITDSTLIEMAENEMFGKKKLLNIPHYLFILKDSNNIQITIDVLGWKPESDNYWPNYDFDVNKLYLLKDGIHGDDFDNILNHIINKEARCEINLKLLHNTLTDVAPKSEKIPKLNQLIFFLTNRMKLIGNGYKICGLDVPDIFIEKKDHCPISNISPPYLSLNLICNHQMSIMTFIGIINEINNYTEAIRCPYCRNSILMKFNEVESTNIISWVPFVPHYEPVQLIIQKSDEIQMFSSESQEYIRNILFKREEPTLPPEREDNIPTVGLIRTREVFGAFPNRISRTSRRINSNSIGYSFSS